MVKVYSQYSTSINAKTYKELLELIKSHWHIELTSEQSNVNKIGRIRIIVHPTIIISISEYPTHYIAELFDINNE